MKASSPLCAIAAILALCVPPAHAQEERCEGWDAAWNPSLFESLTAETVTACIRAGHDPNVRDNKNATPLHKAAYFTRDPAVLTALLAGGADPNARNLDGVTALHTAAGPISARRLPTIVVLLAGVAGCGGTGDSLPASDLERLGRQIVEALARARGEDSTSVVMPDGPLVAVDLSKAVIGTDTWNSIGDPYLARAVGEYAKGAFPGELFDCPPGARGARCFPLSRDDLPSEGLLMFWRTPRDPPNTVTVTHYAFVSVEEAMAERRARGLDEDLTKEYPAWHPDGWLLSTALYSVEVERRADGGWRVGKARVECCV